MSDRVSTGRVVRKVKVKTSKAYKQAQDLNREKLRCQMKKDAAAIDQYIAEIFLTGLGSDTSKGTRVGVQHARDDSDEEVDGRQMLLAEKLEDLLISPCHGQEQDTMQRATSVLDDDSMKDDFDAGGPECRSDGVKW